MKKNQILPVLLCLATAIPLLAQSSDLYIGSNTSGQTTNFSSGTNLYSNTYVGYDTNASNNSLIVSNAGTLLTNTENLLVGVFGNNNSMAVTDGGMAVASNAIVGILSSSNSVLVTGTNTAWSNSGILTIGLFGSENTMTISNGGVVSDTDGYIGYGITSSNNTVIVTTSGSHWNNSGDLYVGYFGSGNSLIMTNQGDTSSGGNTYIGYDTNSFNNSVILNGAQWVVGTNLYVGYSGSGNTAIITDSAYMPIIGDTYIGFNTSASNNSMTLSDSSTCFAQGNFYVGYFGSGNNLTISNAAGIGFFPGGGGNAYIGYDTNSFNNSVVVNNGGWNIATNLYVGYSGLSNTMTITNGGFVHNSGNGYIGYNISSSNNSVTVTGAGSLWTNGGNLYIGLSNGGNGSLFIDNGGQVTASNIIVQNGLLQIGANSASNPLLNSTLTLGGGTSLATLNLLTNVSIATMNWETNAFLALSSPNAALAITNTLNNSTGTNARGEAAFNFSSYSTVGTNVVISFLNQNGFSNSSDFSALTWGNTDTNWSFVLTSSNIQAVFNQATYLGSDLYVGSNTSGNIVDLYDSNNSYNYGSTYVGYSASSSNNFLNVANAGVTLNNTTNLYVGYQGSGNQMAIFNQGQVFDQQGYIGYSSDSSNNSVLVTGSGSLWSNSDTLLIGQSSSGNRLTISNGATVIANYAYFGGNGSSSNNSVLVTGTGSTWTLNNFFYMDSAGSGNTLTISNGGTISNSIGIIGTFGSNNVVQVTGASSTYNNSLYFYLGYYGSENTLIISNGGMVTDVNGYIGAFDTSSNNSVTVTGEASLWTNTILYIGYNGGNGSLFIDNRGEVIADQIFIQNGLLQIGAHSSSNPLANSAIVLGGTNTTATLSLLSDITIASLAWGSNGVLSLTSGSSNPTIQELTISGVMSNTDGYGGSIDFGNYSTMGSSTIITFGTQTGFSSNSFTALDYGVVDTNWSFVLSNNTLQATFTQAIDTNANLYVGITNSGNVVDLYSSNYSYNYSNTYIGYGTNTSNNILNVANAGVILNNTNNVYIGYDGSSSRMAIFNQGVVTSVNGYIGYNADASNNLVTVSGGASWNMSGDLSVGANSSGNTLIISNGTVVDSTGFIGGNESGGISSSNTVLVTGTNTLWQNNYRVKVGYGNGNTLIVADGATVTIGAFTAVGEGLGASDNKIILTGSNTTLTSALNLVIGDNNGSNNQLIIEDGAKAFGTANVYASGVGFAGTNDSVLITGNGSLWFNSNTMVIGGGGEGIVTLSAGGTLGTASNILIAGDFGSTGILNIGSLGGSDTAGNINASTIEFGSGTGIINFNEINDTTVTSTITGLGAINQLGSGTSILSGDNSYSGTTTILNGTLMAGSSNAFGRSAVSLGGSSTTGTLAMTSTLHNFTIGSLNWSSNGIIALTTGSQTLNITDSMSNSGGGGTFVLNGINNQTNTLITFGSETNFTTNDFRLLGITGYSFILNSNNVQGYLAKNANVTNSGKLILNSPLYLGTYTQTSSGILEIQVANSNNYGSIQASGNVQLGGTLEITPTHNTPLFYGEKLTFINAGGPIKGDFSSILVDQPYCRGRLQILGDPQAILTIAPTSYTLVAQSQNQLNVASALNSFIPATSGDELTVSTALDQLTASQYPNAFNQISPTLYTSFATMAFNNAVAQYNEMVQRLGNIRVAGVGFSQNGFSSFPLQDDNKKTTSANDILIPSADNHWGIFVDGNGIFANVNINNQLPGYSVESGGVTLGADYKWNETFSTGIYMGYEGAQSKQTQGTSIVDNGSRFGLFGTYQKGGLFANGIVGGDSHSYQVSRGIQFPGFSRTASSAPTAGELDSLLAGGYDIKRGNWTFGPITSLQYTYFGLQPFTESGAQSLDLSLANANANSLVYSLGSHCFYSWQANKNLLVIPQVNLSWEHEFLQNSYALNSSLGNGTSFDYMSTTPTRNTFFTGIGVTLNLAKKYDASFFYNASACNPSLVSQNFFLSLGMNF